MSSNGPRASRTQPFPDEQFDGVFVKEVFELVADEGRALREARRVLSGGCLALISPNRWFPLEGHGARIFSRTNDAPDTPDPLAAHAADSFLDQRAQQLAGERVQHVRSVGFTIEELGSIRPVLESHPWSPPRAITDCQKHFRSWDQMPIIRRLGESTMVISIKPES